MTARFSHRFTPSIKPVSAEQNPVRIGIFTKYLAEVLCQLGVHLRVLKDRNTFGVLVSCNARKPFQQLVARETDMPDDCELSRKERIPDCVHVENRPGMNPLTINHGVQTRLGRRTTASRYCSPLKVDLEKVRGR